MFGDMVDIIIGMTLLAGGGHAMEGDVRYVSEERVNATSNTTSRVDMILV